MTQAPVPVQVKGFGKSGPAGTPIVALVVAGVIGRVLHQYIAVTTGFIAGVDAVLAAVLLHRSLQGG